MTAKELRIVSVLASIFSLRMLGLCMLLPVFAVEATHYTGATPQLIGLAVGCYGLAQAGLQLPFGMLSDRFGRKPLILLGLFLLLLGSLIAAKATSIYGLILGRCLQGCAAIGSVIIATLADHTREQQRAVSMAILGISIGGAFVLAMIAGPWLSQSFGMPAVFWLTAIFSLFALIISVITIPKTANCSQPYNMPSSLVNLRPRSLWDLNFGVFVLHASLAALFLVLPLVLETAGFAREQLWKLYSLVLAVSLILSLKYMRQMQIWAIVTLVIGQLMLFSFTAKIWLVLGLIVFFTAFCGLEASLPSAIAKYAPAHNRGAAMGVYSSLQFLGIFFGGTIGGWLHAKFGILAVLGFCLILATVWLGMSIRVNREQGFNYG